MNENKREDIDSLRSVSVEDPFRAGSATRHKRLLHRLSTARWVIWGGLAFIFVMSIFYLYAYVLEDGVGATTIFVTLTSTITTIVILPRDYIADSNIERIRDILARLAETNDKKYLTNYRKKN